MSQLERFQGERKLLTPQHAGWVNQYLDKGSNYPVTLEIDPTNRCPLNCAHCIWNDFRLLSKDSLQPATLLRVVNEAADIGVKSIIWTGGGEPLAHPTTLDAIALAAARGMRNGMFTTAVPLTGRAVDVLLQDVDWIRVHVDGATPQSYAQAHRVSEQVFGRVVGNLGNFTAARQQSGSETSIGIGTVALALNFQEAPEIARLAKDNGLDFFQYKHDLTKMTDPEYLQWWNSFVVPMLDGLSEELEDEKFRLQYSKGVNYVAPDLSSKCHVRFLSTAITADGRVAYCKSTRDRFGWSLGSIYEKSLREIFDDEISRQLVAEVTPTTCGILPCPYKTSNIRLQQIIDTGDRSPIGTAVPMEHQEFI